MPRIVTLIVFVLGIHCSVSAVFSQVAGPGKDGIDFDSRVGFAFRDVSPPGFTASDKDRKVVEVAVRVSANFRISEQDLECVVYQLDIPGEAEIADFLPNTRLATDVSGTIDTSQQVANRQGVTVGFEIGGKLQYQIPLVMEASADVRKTDTSEKRSDVNSSVQIKLLPPKQLVVSAGTRNRGKSLYYKLRPFSQITLEGEKEFAVLMIVPRQWNGGVVGLHCYGFRKGYTAEEATKSMALAVYAEGDGASRATYEAAALKMALATPKFVDVMPSGKAEPAPVDGPTLEGLAGNYAYDLKTYDGNTTRCLFNLTKDGKWTGEEGAGWTSVKTTGTWLIKESRLTIDSFRGKNLYGKEVWSKYIDNAIIQSFDSKAGVIILNDGRRLYRP